MQRGASHSLESFGFLAPSSPIVLRGDWRDENAVFVDVFCPRVNALLFTPFGVVGGEESKTSP